MDEQRNSKLRFLPVAAGIDTLSLAYSVTSMRGVSHEDWQMLWEAKLKGQKQGFHATGERVEFQGVEFIVRPKGGSGYAYILQNDDMEVAISPHITKGRLIPEIKVELRSRLLWHKGWDMAVLFVDAWVNSWSSVVGMTVARLDLAVDVPQALPRISEIDNVVTRARAKTVYHTIESGYQDNRERFSVGARQTGYRFGRGGPLVARIYDKDAEIEHSGKEWMKDIWRENGWDGEAPVTRVEFQLRRDVLKEMGIEDVTSVRTRMGDVWEYLTNDWLRVVRRSRRDGHRHRWPVHPFWRPVMKASPMFGELVNRIERERQFAPSGVLLEKMALGIMTSMVAMAWCSGQERAHHVLKDAIDRVWGSPEYFQDVLKKIARYGGVKPDAPLPVLGGVE